MSDENLQEAGSKPCLNCNQKLFPKALYCAYCGQKDSDGKISLFQFFSEFFKSVFDIDSRFFKTLRHIFIPAKLTKAYFEGKHKKYAHPLRVFFIIAVVHLSLIAIIALNAIGEGINNTPLNTERDRKLRSEVMEQIENFQEQERENEAEARDLEMLDSLKQFVRANVSVTPDTTNSMFVGSFDFDSLKFTQKSISYHDMATLSLEEIFEKYEANDFLSKTIIQQSIKANEEPKSMIRFAIGNMVWMLFLLMPALAGIMKLLYIRRNYFYIEHLVFLYHWHSFSFIVMSVYFLLVYQIPPAFLPLVFLIFFVFGFIAMKRYYRQGFFKTIIKFIILLFVYFMFLSALVGLTGVISMLVF